MGLLPHSFYCNINFLFTIRKKCYIIIVYVNKIKERTYPIKMQDSLKTLKEYFGYDSFRPGQEMVVDAIMSGRDVLAVMPTGSGKSVCYQVPALMKSGITLVISPLISLMRDQVSALVSVGVRAAYLNSTLTPAQCRLAIDNAKAGIYKIIYVAPERLATPAFREFTAVADIGLVAIDESHCVSEWGHDFRRSYLEIKDFIASLKRRPVVAAFTATATEQVRHDICKLLALDSPEVFTTGYDRPGLYFGIKSSRDKLGYVVDFIKRRPDKSGIIYCATRRNTEALCETLIDRGIDAVKYHAGLTEDERNRNQDEFVYDRCRIIVATNAFGMGIDKSNVSFVLHYNMPLSIEAYYQEAGRAGRDGMDAECVLLFSEQDVKLGRYIISKTAGEAEEDEAEARRLRDISIRKLERMAELCRAATCVRANILGYFGEAYNTPCNKCSYCLRHNKEVTLDGAKRVIGSLILRTGGRFGVNAVADILAGARNQKLIARGYDRLYEFGQLSFRDRSSIKDVIAEMIDEGLLYKTAGEYPLLKLTDKYMKVCAESAKEPVNVRINAIERQIRPNAKLLSELKEWRRKTAARLGVPPYIVFNDMTLTLIALAKPVSFWELIKIKGVAQQKASRYCDEIVKIISDFNKRT